MDGDLDLTKKIKKAADDCNELRIKEYEKQLADQKKLMEGCLCIYLGM